MADINALIAQGITPIQVETPLNQMAKMYAVQGAMQQNELNRMKMEEYQRGIKEQEQLRTAIPQDFDPTNPLHVASVYKAAPTLAPNLVEKALMARKTTQEIASSRAEEAYKKQQTQESQIKTLGVGLVNALSNPSDEVLNRTFDTLDAQGINTKPFRDQFSAIPDLGQRRSIIQNYVTSHPEGRAALEFVQPKWTEQSDNKSKWLRDTNPNSPSFGQVTNKFAMSATPGELLTDANAKARLEFEKEKAAEPIYKEGGFVVKPSKEQPSGKFIPIPEAQQAKDQQAAVRALKSAGYDAETGKDNISDLINKSTSGVVQNVSSQALGAFGISTSGRKAIAALEGTANQIATDMLGGKLGAGISNADRDFIVSALGDVANANKPAGERLAGWLAAKNRMITTGLLPSPKKTAPAGEAATAPNVDALLKKYQ